MHDYPDACLRALRKQEEFDEVGPTFSAFLPDKRTLEKRKVGQETSINWDDDDRALEFTRKKPNTLKVTRLMRQSLDELNKKPGSANSVFYDREELSDNKYHGNIVFRAHLDTGRVRMIASILALEAVIV